MPPDKKFLDKLTDIDNLTAENTGVLREVKKEAAAGNASLQLIAEKLGAEAIAPRYDATFPLTGTQEIPLGTTTFNFKNGDVILSGVEIPMRMSHPIDQTVRSIEIITEKEIVVELYEGDRSELETSVFPRIFRKTYLEFDRCSILASSGTNIWMAVSTEPEGVPEIKLADFKEGNPFITTGAVAVPGTTVDVDVRGTLGRNAHDGIITNLGVGIGILHVYFSNDGTTFTTGFKRINPFGVLNLENEDVDTLRLDTDVGGTQYEIFLS